MALSDEDKQEVSDLLKTQIGEHFKSDDFAKDMKKALRPVVAGVVKSEVKDLGIEEGSLSTLTERLDKLEKEPPTGGTKDDDKNKSPAVKDSPEYKAMQKQLDEMRKASEDKDAKARTDRIKANFMAEAAKHIAPGGGDMAYAHLSSLLTEDDEGNTVVGIKKDGYEETVSVAEYLKDEFLPSDAGKLLAPAKGGGGSGGRPGGEKPGSGGGKPTANDVLDTALGL